MGRGSAKPAVACGVLAVALAAAGCGAQARHNDQRPQAPSRVSVTIGPKAILVQPRAIGTGPDRTQQIPQNQNQAQPPTHSRGPLTVVLVAANQTETDSRLELRGPRDASSGPLPAHSPGTMQVDLPSGAYAITAAGIPSARPGKLIVGPYRASSQNDVLLP